MEKTFDLKVPAARARELDLNTILNAEKLLHLHPHWTVEECRDQDNGIVASLTDYETDDEFKIGLRLDFTESTVQNSTDNRTVLRILLSDFAINEILFYAEQDTMRVKVSGSGDNIDEELEESIFLWIRSIQEYIRLYTSNSPVARLFRLVMNKIILKMNPSQRKICIMLTKITVVEVLVIVVIVVGYFFFVQ